MPRRPPLLASPYLEFRYSHNAVPLNRSAPAFEPEFHNEYLKVRYTSENERRSNDARAVSLPAQRAERQR